jgi:hypothetical protein
MPVSAAIFLSHSTKQIHDFKSNWQQHSAQFAIVASVE